MLIFRCVVVYETRNGLSPKSSNSQIFVKSHQYVKFCIRAHVKKKLSPLIFAKLRGKKIRKKSNLNIFQSSITY